MTATATEPTNDELLGELAEVAARLNRRQSDLARRRELYQLLSARGFTHARIAEVASIGRDKPLGYKSVGFILNSPPGGAAAWRKQKARKRAAS